MTDFISRKKWFKYSFLSTSLILLSSCYSLGLDSIPAEKEPFHLIACPQSASAPLRLESEAFDLNIVFKGFASPLASAQNILGRTVRYVVPYTRQTLLFELSAENKQDQILKIQPEKIALQLSDTQRLQPLSLSYFKKRWPAGAVNSSDALLDRAAALGEVTRTLFTAYPVLPQAKQMGVLPFPVFDLEKGQQIVLRLNGVQYGSESQDLSFCFQAE
jgi:hypothetical protein